MTIIKYIWNAPRTIKRLISIGFDVCFVSLAYWGAYWTRLGSDTSFFYDKGYQSSYLITLIVTVFIFVQVGLYRAILRYMNTKAMFTILSSCVLSAMSIAFVSYFTHSAVPRSVTIIYVAYLLLLCGGARLVARSMINRTGRSEKAKVIIYGAGSAGRQLVNLLNQGKEYHPVCFIDDSPKLHKASVHGLNIYSSQLIDKLIERYKVKKILLALPSASRSQRKQIISDLVSYNIEVLSIPSLDDLVNGNLGIDQLKEVAIEDLLGRDSVQPDEQLLKQDIYNKVVMVTGAGGSIGSELCRQIVTQKPKLLILFEISEFALYQLDAELRGIVSRENFDCEVVPLLGSVQRIHRLSMVMKSFSVETIYHAAAYKHVPLVEYNVVEGVRNNVFGTFYTAKAAIEANVKSFVLISTDKAVRPTNVMGATKRLAELSLQALASCQSSKEDRIRFTMVRFGNVLGSSGSVIPLFKKQIEQGGPVTVTHPDIIRYFMTIPEAAQLVIQAGAMGQGGDVFVLDMGEPVKIRDLAVNLIHLSGLDVINEDNPHGDIEIVFTGLRPGEKLFEELLIGANVSSTKHTRIMSANEEFLSLTDLEELLRNLDEACHQFEHERIRELLLSAPTGFSPTDGICDLVYKQKLSGCYNNVL
ncbi:nucleoside-diphosphate sugar epimerase/dehydratase [Vibrio scophthalmi]|uniref:Capsular polysaccharide biosynthesis protein CapD n=1 Tax=Vibrio scophthalmi TaxID=45658 RepID=A0A1E3WJK3_9VIBR|nr:nucleoside-diphosphate sugar epimerase/dehydratase [Vibrio scophthalmi]ODS09953.1 Capsular polysaccharide biosynthesis protein CapD [Vibrio scophthalmi]